MGGNAFENTARLTEEQYEALCRKIAEALDAMNLRYKFPPEVKDKAQLLLGTYITVDQGFQTLNFICF